MKSQLCFALCILILLNWNLGLAQTTDSLLIITPGLSPTVVEHGQVELNLFNALNTEQSVFEFDTIRETSRYTSLFHVLQVGYGISKTNRWNIGGMFIFGHTRVDQNEDRSPFAVLGSGDADATVFHQAAAIGIFARAIPFRNLPELAVQGTLLFPATRDKLARQYSGYDRTLAQLQLSFYQQFTPLFYLFGSAGGSVLLPNSTRKQTTLLVPIQVYPVLHLGYDSKAYLFASLSYSGQFNKVSPGFLRGNGYRILYGLGGQYYFKPTLSLYAQVQLPATISTKSITTTVPTADAYGLGLGGRWAF